ncbi:MAG: hypothetical protein KKH94_06280 [Candidatus Omnitrophica bacterium]|nr:hypothetical protein [Candidatus Omnitrophota bacterium]
MKKVIALLIAASLLFVMPVTAQEMVVKEEMTVFHPTIKLEVVKPAILGPTNSSCTPEVCVLAKGVSYIMNQHNNSDTIMRTYYVYELLLKGPLHSVDDWNDNSFPRKKGISEISVGLFTREKLFDLTGMVKPGFYKVFARIAYSISVYDEVGLPSVLDENNLPKNSVITYYDYKTSDLSNSVPLVINASNEDVLDAIADVNSNVVSVVDNVQAIQKQTKRNYTLLQKIYKLLLIKPRKLLMKIKK